MIITTITTCDDNVPHTIVCTDPADVEAQLTDHYDAVWDTSDPIGEKPIGWQALEAELRMQDLLRDHQTAHVKEHRFIHATSHEHL